MSVESYGTVVDINDNPTYCPNVFTLNLVSWDEDTKYALYMGEFKNYDTGQDRWFWARIFFCPEMFCANYYDPVSGTTTKVPRCSVYYGSLTWWISKNSSTNTPPTDPLDGGADYDPIRTIAITANTRRGHSQFYERVPDPPPSSDYTYFRYPRNYGSQSPTHPSTIAYLENFWPFEWEDTTGEHVPTSWQSQAGSPPPDSNYYFTGYYPSDVWRKYFDLVDELRFSKVYCQVIPARPYLFTNGSLYTRQKETAILNLSSGGYGWFTTPMNVISTSSSQSGMVGEKHYGYIDIGDCIHEWYNPIYGDDDGRPTGSSRH
jgi:hypothetical protein